MKPIWIVDDDQSIRFVLEKALAREQLPVRSFANPREVLHALNRRAEMQLRLQETVEGLSVVAISYYALNLAAHLLAPMAEAVLVMVLMA